MKEVKTYFLQALPPSEINIFTNSSEEKTCLFCLVLCLLFIFECQTPICLQEFLNVLPPYVEANPV